MKNLLLSFIICLSSFVYATEYPPDYYIPAAGQTINSLQFLDIAGQHFFVGTNGAVNLGANTYTLTYASLPYASTTWWVLFDATDLTLNSGSQVNLFGETPLTRFPEAKKFYMMFTVVYGPSGTPTKTVKYLPSLEDVLEPPGPVSFGWPVNIDTTFTLDDSVIVRGPLVFGTPLNPYTNRPTLCISDSGQVGQGCVAWCTDGNAGTIAGTNFVGTTDAQDLVFKTNSIESGRIGESSANISFGALALTNATVSGISNVAIGDGAMLDNTDGASNTAVGAGAMANNTTGISNVGVGIAALQTQTTASRNVGVGMSAGFTISTGERNTCIGAQADVATGATTKAIALGSGAVAASYQLAIGGIRSISIPQMTSCANCVLMDTTAGGTGAFVPRPVSSTGMRDLHASFEATAQGAYYITFPQAATVSAIEVRVEDVVAGTDDGELLLQDNSLTNMAGSALAAGVMTITASSTTGTGFTSTLTANNTFTANQRMKITTSKTTAGGTLNIQITYTQ